MARYNITFDFMMQARTVGYSIEAASVEEARAKADDCLVSGFLDLEAFEQAGGRALSWRTMPGTDHDYELREVTEDGRG